MSDTKAIATNLMKVIKLYDKLRVIGVKEEDEELVPIALNRFSPSWDLFLWGVYAHEKLTNL